MRNFALEVYFSKWEFAAKYHLTASDAQSMTVSQLLSHASAEDRERFDNLHLGYTKTFGAEPLLEQIVRTYEAIATDQLLCFAGAEEGIYVAMRVLLQPEDHCIVITPNYQAAETIPLSICAVTGVALDENANWALDLDKVRAALRPNTKLISINFPNNPTGAIPSQEIFAGLIELCRERGIWLFSDEVYRLIEHRPDARIRAVLDQAVDLVAEQPDPALPAKLDQAGEDLLRGDRAGGVVGEVDRDELCIRPQRRAHLVEIERPVRIFIQRDPGHRADRERDRLGGLIVGGDDDAVVLGLQQHAHRDIDAFFRAREAQQLVGGDGFVGADNLFQQRFSAERLGIAEVQVVEPLAIFRRCVRKQLRNRHALRVGCGEMILRGKLPLRKIHLQRKIPHRSFVLSRR